MKYSIVIPAYNEGKVIKRFVCDFFEKIAGEFPDQEFEILIIENGSTDETLTETEEAAHLYPDVISVYSNERRSYGEAIKRGIMEASGEYLSVLECDFLKPEFIRFSLDLIKDMQARFIVASKQHPMSQDDRPFKRRLFTYLFNKIIAFAVDYPGGDTHGLKTIEVNLAKSLCAIAETTDEIFQTEIVLLAWAQGEDIYEVPISLREIRDAPVSIPKRFPMVIRMIKELKASLRRFTRTGVARKKPIVAGNSGDTVTTQ